MEPLGAPQAEDHRRRTLLLALGVGLLGGLYVWYYYSLRQPTYWSDFDQIWIGARALLQNKDPYAEVVASNFPWPLYYPAPALLLGIPFAPFSLLMARVLFAGVSAGLCAYALLKWRPYAWPLLCTGPFLYALQRGQWSPLLVASVLLPAIRAVLVAKPTIGLAIFAYRPSWTAVVSGLALGFLAFIWIPDWPWRWLESRHSAHHMVLPALLPGGWLLLAAMLRWRRPEARLLAVLALVPQTFSMYELVSLWLIPRTRREALVLGIAFNLVYLAMLPLYGPPLVPSSVYRNYLPASWFPTLVIGYLPALWIVLRPFPLWRLPPELASWPPWRRIGYLALWGLVLCSIVVAGVGGLWLIWHGLVIPTWTHAVGQAIE